MAPHEGQVFGGEARGKLGRGVKLAEVLAKGVDVSDLEVDEAVLYRFEAGLAGGIGGVHGDDLADPASCVVDNGTPEGAGLPPAGIGGLVAEGDEDGNGRAVEGERDVGQGDPLPVQEVEGDHNAEVVEGEEKQGPAGIPDHAEEVRPLGYDHAVSSSRCSSRVTTLKSRLPSSEMRTSPEPMS